MANLNDELKNKSFRSSYAEGRVARRLARRHKSIREQEGLSQNEMGEKMGGLPQSAISRLENPSYGKHSMTTLNKAAAAFDLVLWVDYISFGEFLRRIKTDNPTAEVLPYDKEQQALAQHEMEASAARQAAFSVGGANKAAGGIPEIIKNVYPNSGLPLEYNSRQGAGLAGAA